MYSHSSWGLELYDEKINDATKTFVIRYTASSYKDGVPDKQSYYVSYGYYTIDRVYEDDEYIEYHLNLEYIVKDKNAPDWNTMTVTVREDKISCSYNGHSLYKR